MLSQIKITIIDFNEKLKSIKKQKEIKKRKESIDRLVQKANKFDW